MYEDVAVAGLSPLWRVYAGGGWTDVIYHRFRGGGDRRYSAQRLPLRDRSHRPFSSHANGRGSRRRECAGVRQPASGYPHCTPATPVSLVPTLLLMVHMPRVFLPGPFLPPLCLLGLFLRCRLLGRRRGC